MDPGALREIGMNEAEIRVYATLIRHRPLGAREIAEKSGIYRPYVYDTLAKLMKKGLVTKVWRMGCSHAQNIYRSVL
jgi:sugar-specific transcriptional regulator TrmB